MAFCEILLYYVLLILLDYLLGSVVGPSLGGFLGDAETYFPSIVKAYPWIRDVRELFEWMIDIVTVSLSLETSIPSWIGWLSAVHSYSHSHHLYAQ